MDYGDIPGWIALLISGYGLYYSVCSVKKVGRYQVLREISDLINEIYRLSARYWTSKEGESAALGVEIATLFRTLSSKMALCEALNDREVVDKRILLKRHVTGGDFQCLNRVPHDFSSEFVMNIDRLSKGLNIYVEMEISKNNPFS